LQRDITLINQKLGGNIIMTDFNDGFLAMPIQSMDEVIPAQGATSGLLKPSGIAVHYCGITNFTVGDIMAYGFRRFGYPVNGWDSYKQLCEWIMRTPMDKVFLTLQPTTHSPFGYLLRDSLSAELRAEQYNNGKLDRFSHDPLSNEVSATPYWEVLPITSLERQVNEALRRTIIDMRRPVSIRDWQIDILGKCSGEGFRHFAEDDNGYEEIVQDLFAPKSSQSGYGLYNCIKVNRIK
jgi:hypothetical protein